MRSAIAESSAVDGEPEAAGGAVVAATVGLAGTGALAGCSDAGAAAHALASTSESDRRAVGLPNSGMATW